MKSCYLVGRHRVIGETKRAVIPSLPLFSLYTARPGMSNIPLVTLWLHLLPFYLSYVRVNY